MEPAIVRPDPRYSRARLIEPTTLGYVHLSARVNPRPMPFLPAPPERRRLLDRVEPLVRPLERLVQVERVSVFDGALIAPVERMSGYLRQRAASIHPARFDVVVLIETTSPDTARALRDAPEYQALLDTLRGGSSDLHVMLARNLKRLGDVPRTRRGVYLFNYFVADDPEVALELWDYLAGWYQVETGLDNSLLMAPLEGEPSDYVFVNHAHWDANLPTLFVRQMAKPSFRRYVLANLEANRVGSMPALYRPA
jgi:hypothetical protein